MTAADTAIRKRLTQAVADLFAQVDRELDVFDVRTRDAARAMTDLVVEKSPTRVGQKAPVPRGHCDRCPVCGWPFDEAPRGGCRPGDCSERPYPKTVRLTCAGCGAPFEDPPPPIDPALLCAVCFRRDTTTIDEAGAVHCGVCGETTPAPKGELSP